MIFRPGFKIQSMLELKRSMLLKINRMRILLSAGTDDIP